MPCLGLPREKSAGISYQSPLYGDLVFLDQSAVDQYVMDYSRLKHLNTVSVFVVVVCVCVFFLFRFFQISKSIIISNTYFRIVMIFSLEVECRVHLGTKV